MAEGTSPSSLPQSSSGRLGDVPLARARRPDQQDVPRLTDEPPRGQVEDLPAFDRRVEREVELVQRLVFTEAGGLDAAGDQPLIAHQQLVLQQKLEELAIAQVMTGGLLQAHVQRCGRSREPKLSKGGLQRLCGLGVDGDLPELLIEQTDDATNH